MRRHGCSSERIYNAHKALPPSQGKQTLRSAVMATTNLHADRRRRRSADGFLRRSTASNGLITYDGAGFDSSTPRQSPPCDSVGCKVVVFRNPCTLRKTILRPGANEIRRVDHHKVIWESQNVLFSGLRDSWERWRRHALLMYRRKSIQFWFVAARDRKQRTSLHPLAVLMRSCTPLFPVVLCTGAIAVPTFVQIWAASDPCWAALLESEHFPSLTRSQTFDCAPDQAPRRKEILGPTTGTQPDAAGNLDSSRLPNAVSSLRYQRRRTAGMSVLP